MLSQKARAPVVRLSTHPVLGLLCGTFWALLLLVTAVTYSSYYRDFCFTDKNYSQLRVVCMLQNTLKHCIASRTTPLCTVYVVGQRRHLSPSPLLSSEQSITSPAPTFPWEELVSSRSP